MTRLRSPRLRSTPSLEADRSAKTLPLSRDADAPLGELSALCEMQRRELVEATTALKEARRRARRHERLLSLLKGRLELAEERVATLEQDAATAYALAPERQPRAPMQLAQELMEAREQLATERTKAAMEIANLRDALAAALERERTIAHATGSADSVEVAANRLHLVP